MENVVAKISLVPTHVRILRNKKNANSFAVLFLRFNLSEYQMNSDVQLISRAHHHK